MLVLTPSFSVKRAMNPASSVIAFCGSRPPRIWHVANHASSACGLTGCLSRSLLNVAIAPSYIAASPFSRPCACWMLPFTISVCASISAFGFVASRLSERSSAFVKSPLFSAVAVRICIASVVKRQSL